MKRRRSTISDLIDGAIAGAVATWAMGMVTTYLYDHESRAARQREDEAREGNTAYAVAAEKAARLVGAQLTEEQRNTYGSAIHWGLGIAAGAVYGVLRPRQRGAEVAHGLALGMAFWLLMDEAAVYALELAPGPTAFPWQTHARGLAGHLTFGTVTDATLHALQPTV